MASIKIFALGGLDQKSNDLTRSVEKASDMLNLEYNTQSTLKKRNGFEVFSTEDSKDMVYYNSKEEFLLFNQSTNVTILDKNGATKSYNGNSYYPLPYGISALSNVSISYCENSNNLYFTNTDYNTYVMKYDGGHIYRAGLPTPRKSQVSKLDTFPTMTNGTSGFYTRIFYSYKDINGNVTYSPYVQLDQSGSTTSLLSVNSFAIDTNCLENGFYNKYCFRDGSSTQTISELSRTLNTTKHNYVVGDLFLIDTENACISLSPQNRDFIVLEVESVVPNTAITFKQSSFNGVSISFSVYTAYNQGVGGTSYPVDIRSLIITATSSDPDTGFTLSGRSVLDNSIALNGLYCLGYDGFNFKSKIANKTIAFEDVYDSTTLKIMPPICKYISSFGSQIVYGSVQSLFTGFTNITGTPNQRNLYVNDDFIIYSDTSAGDGPENVSDLNIQKIGETWDGFITGMRRCNDSLVIFKNRGVFSIDGILISGEYQLRKINTNFAGCTSHKSILESDEGLYFQAHNGLYFTNAIGVKKISYEIDSVFNSANYNTTRAVRLKKKQKALFYVPQLSKVVVVDYYYNQIYFWDSIDSSCGIVEDSLGNVYFSNGSNVYKFNDGYLDAGNAINAYYATTWHHAGEPSLNKKWLSMRMFALTDEAYTATIETHGDWDIHNPLTSNQLVFTDDDQTKFLMFDMKTKRSFRIIFSNNVKKETSPGSGIYIGENLPITGYELNYEMFNNVDKN